MKKIFCLAFWLGLFLTPIYATASPLEIMTGQQTGSYYKIGKDIQRVLAPKVKINVYPSTGSSTTLTVVGSEHHSIPLGIIQLDVTDSLRMSSNIADRKIAQAVRVVLPLYDEEIHLLATENIKQPSDLKGKRVETGVYGSGTHVTATMLLRKLNVALAEEIQVGNLENAIEKMLRGEVDAMFYVVGAPASLFQNKITAKDKFHFVPITTVMSDAYSMVTIPAFTYFWQHEDVKTVAVKSWFEKNQMRKKPSFWKKTVFLSGAYLVQSYFTSISIRRFVVKADDVSCTMDLS